MLSKSVFKQTLVQNWKLWLIFTLVASGIAAAIINTFDPHAMRLAMQAFGSDGPPAGMGGGPLGTGTSRFGLFTIPDLMASGYYAMLGLIMPLVYVVVTAHGLIAAQVDRGTMAYTLSTPVTRGKVVFTQATYLIVALFAMFSMVTVAGLATSQLSHNALWGQAHTADVVAVSEVLGMSPEALSSNTRLISENPEAMAIGAEARGISEDVYFWYLELLAIDTALEGQTTQSRVTQLAELHGLGHTLQDIQMETLMVGAEAAAQYLEMELPQLMTQLHMVVQEPGALAIAAQASGVDEATLLTVINLQLAEAEFEFDQGIYFNPGHFVNLNVGIFLLMFAIGGLSFMFSCIFNFSRHALALGAGIPFAFFILNMMANASPDFANLRFLTLNTLYSPMDIVGGYTFVPQFLAMAIVGLALYTVGVTVFKRKDLPL